MQNRDDYLKSIGIQQWQRRSVAAQKQPAWHCQGPDNAAFAFIWQQQNHLALDWELPELKLLQKIMQAVGISSEQALLLWPLQEDASAAPQLPQSCCCVVFGDALGQQVKHTKKIATVTLPELTQNTEAKRALWQALKTAKNHG